jgi:hypothetical protein
MQHVDRFLKLGDVTDTVLQSGMNSDLTDTGTDCRHWLPIGWLQSLLNLSKLKTCERLASGGNA